MQKQQKGIVPKGTVPKGDLYVGSAPADEDCAQVGADGYLFRTRLECWALMQQLRRTLGPEPKGTRLYVRENPHDFGAYLSVNCAYPDGDPQGTAYAYRCEAELPAHWDEQARAYLGLDAPSAGNGKAKSRTRSRTEKPKSKSPPKRKDGQKGGDR